MNTIIDFGSTEVRTIVKLFNNGVNTAVIGAEFNLASSMVHRIIAIHNELQTHDREHHEGRE